MRKFLLVLVAFFVVGTNYAVVKSGSKLDIKISGITPDKMIDESDGTFKVAMTYDLQMPDKLKEDYLDAMFYYSVTFNGTEVSNGQKNAADINDGFVNFYIDGLETGKEYKIAINKIEVYNYSKIDWDTFEIPLEFYQNGILAEKTFTTNGVVIGVTNLAADNNMDIDGTLKVAMDYDWQISTGLQDYIFGLAPYFYYSITCEGKEVYSGIGNPNDITDGEVNFYINELEVGKEYKLTVDRIEVYNYFDWDDETGYFPIEFQEDGEIASTTFTIPMDIRVTKITPDSRLDVKDGTFKVAMAYDLQMAEELKEDYLDATFYYSVTCDGEEVSNGLKNANDINDGFVNFYVDGLEAGKEYKITVNKIEVYNYSKIDWDTFEIPLEFYEEGEIASTTFLVSEASLGINALELVPSKELEFDETFKVSMTYEYQIAKELRKNISAIQPWFYYTVTCNGEVVDSNVVKAIDLKDNELNIYISGLEAGKEYEFSIKKIEVYNFFEVDYDVMYAPLEFYQEGEIASITFTIADPTAINKVSMDEKQTIYNLNGVRLNKETKGVNIINGKKFFVK